MNLIIKLLEMLGYNHKDIRYKDRENRDFNDYGYELYQSLEYNLKYLKGDNFGYGGNPQTQSIYESRNIF